MEEKIDLVLKRMGEIEGRLEGIEHSLQLLKTLKADVAYLKQNQVGIIDHQASQDESIDSHTEDIKGLKFTCHNLLARDTKVESKITQLVKENKEKEGKLNTLKKEINNLEQYGRRVMVDIRRYPPN